MDKEICPSIIEFEAACGVWCRLRYTGTTTDDFEIAKQRVVGIIALIVVRELLSRPVAEYEELDGRHI